MKVTNSKDETYNFTEKEMLKVFMYAYGYIDLSIKGHLPIDLGKNVEISNLNKKLRQCFKDEYEVIEKTIGGEYEKI